MGFDKSLGAVFGTPLPAAGISKRKMFGRICFLISGNLLVGVSKLSLIPRLGPDEGKA